jgi:hypothetical protein
MVDRDSGAGSISLAEDKNVVDSHEKVANDSRCEHPLGEEIPHGLGSLGVRNYQGALSTREIWLNKFGKVIEWFNYSTLTLGTISHLAAA